MRAQMENGCVEGHKFECGFDRYYGENQQSIISTIARAQVKLRIRIAALEEDVGHERKDHKTIHWRFTKIVRPPAADVDISYPTKSAVGGG